VRLTSKNGTFWKFPKWSDGTNCIANPNPNVNVNANTKGEHQHQYQHQGQ